MIPKLRLKKKGNMLQKHLIFHRENRDCNRLGTIPSNNIKNSRLSNGFESPHFQVKLPFSKRLNQMTRPSLSQKSTFMWSLRRLRKTKNAPDKSSPGNNPSTVALKPSKLLRILMGNWQKNNRALPEIVSINPPSKPGGIFLK